MAIDFSGLITINKKWVDNEFNHHYTEKVNDKLNIRLYSIKPSGTTINSISLANTLLDILPYYFKSKSEIDKQVQREISKTINDYTSASDIDQKEEIAKIVHARTYREAKSFFKKKSSDSKSGKYGELLLFGLVEAVFDCKMIAHKITNLTNYHDEVKGGDGIFMGNYKLPNGNIEVAYLIGESKVWKDYSGAKKDALESINRFYDSKIQADFKTLEFFIAQKDIEKVVGNQIDIDELYDRLDQKSELFKSQIAVHPILIMYETKNYNNLMKNALNCTELTNLIDINIKSKLDKTLEKIALKVKEFPELEKVFLDFILIPTNSVADFNDTMDNLI
ncbi:Hachiman antiphage defense system protein HamA [Flavobacterium ardleyense]|uniref:Hachiman antiphage defense system protein HamA n=1 Tax=Flavobacterium ardleyense TaxID=2038737 RepID=A0ABW5Z4L3_9FLAO